MSFDIETKEGPMEVSVDAERITVRRKQTPAITEEKYSSEGKSATLHFEGNAHPLAKAVMAGGPFFHCWWIGHDYAKVDVEAGFQRYTKGVDRKELLRKWFKPLGLKAKQVKEFLHAEPEEGR